MIVDVVVVMDFLSSNLPIHPHLISSRLLLRLSFLLLLLDPYFSISYGRLGSTPARRTRRAPSSLLVKTPYHAFGRRSGMGWVGKGCRTSVASPRHLVFASSSA